MQLSYERIQNNSTKMNTELERQLDHFNNRKIQAYMKV